MIAIGNLNGPLTTVRCGARQTISHENMIPDEDAAISP